jgi:hypothetical protein
VKKEGGRAKGGTAATTLSFRARHLSYKRTRKEDAVNDKAYWLQGDERTESEKKVEAGNKRLD